MTPHPCYQHKPEELFLTAFVIYYQGRTRALRWTRRPVESVLGHFRYGSATCPTSELQRTSNAAVAEILAQPKIGFAGYESSCYWIVNQE